MASSTAAVYVIRFALPRVSLFHPSNDLGRRVMRYKARALTRDSSWRLAMKHVQATAEAHRTRRLTSTGYNFGVAGVLQCALAFTATIGVRVYTCATSFVFFEVVAQGNGKGFAWTVEYANVWRH
ncbi:hypothetical protein Trydic_g9587 [Trypoxylus dichotomus]